MEYQFINRYKSLVRSVDQLRCSEGVDKHENSFVLPGTVQNFNLSFDLSWKVMKEILDEYYGVGDFATGSPKQTLRKAFEVGLIDDDVWMIMLDRRNRLAHDYDGVLAESYFDDIVGTYMGIFDSLTDRIENIINENE